LEHDDTGPAPRPHFVTIHGGQVRLWISGEGANLIVLPGLVRSAESAARRFARNNPGWRVIAVELPGIGYSTAPPGADTHAVAGQIAESLDWLGEESCVLVALDLACPIAEILAARGLLRVARVVTLGRETACRWKTAGISPPDLSPRQDGTHLFALWSFLRDRHLLVPDNPGLPLDDGEPVPSVDMFSDTFVCAAQDPSGFSMAWRNCITALQSPASVATPDLACDADLDLSGVRLQEGRAAPPPTDPVADGAIWHDYVETANGRLHLRRAGANGDPLLVIPTGGGSSAQFAPVISGLSGGRSVFAVDYPGNGLSAPPEGEVSIHSLANDLIVLLDAMGIERTDIWGSHTGSLVALDMAVIAPERVRRIVMEGPVFIDPGLQDDILANYFLDFTPDKWGRHLLSVWNWRRDMFMYWPWYRVERTAARHLGVPDADQLHLYALGILESGGTYDLAYRSAFSYDTGARLAKLTRPALVCAGPNDQLRNGVAEARRLGPSGLVTAKETPTTVWWPDPDPDEARETLAVYDSYLRQAVRD